MQSRLNILVMHIILEHLYEIHIQLRLCLVLFHIPCAIETSIIVVLSREAIETKRTHIILLLN